MFKVTVDQEDIGEFEKFTDAFRIFYEKVLDKMDPTTTLKWLGTANFIQYSGPRVAGVMDFYQAFNFARETGLLTEGELNKQAPEPAIELVEKTLSSKGRAQSRSKR